MIDFKKNLAFTLAETLIVMSIIGVVAALTIPNLNQATGEKEKVARVKKLYSNLEDAIGRTEAIYGALSEWDSSNLTGAVLEGRMVDFIKHSKECAANTPSGCFSSNSVNPFASGGTSVDIASNGGYFVTADGSSVGVVGSGDLVVYIDIDGPSKGTNKLGEDIFQFYLNSGNDYLLTPAGRGSYDSNLSACISDSNCTAWVVDYDNMDYKKLGTDGKCPDGSTVLNASKTSCK